MRAEPAIKRTIAFVDGQNLFYAAKAAFGYTYPNYDPRALAERECAKKNWKLVETRFYTGVPSESDDVFWNKFWSSKKLSMSRQGVRIFTRELKYRSKSFRDVDGKTHQLRVADEKGIDVRIAIDAISCVVLDKCDVVLIFSQDQDLSEVAHEIRAISRQTGRWIKIASAFPVSESCTNKRGINKTDWIKIDRADYDACLDLRDHRPPKS